MGYVEETIGKNEKVVYIVQFHWTYSFVAFFYLIFFGIFVIGIVIFLKMMINKWTTERVLTDARYIQKTGWISRESEEISIYKIEEVDLSQTIIGRMFGYGSISISGTGSGNIVLKSIDDPLKFQKHLNDLRYNKLPI